MYSMSKGGSLRISTASTAARSRTAGAPVRYQALASPRHLDRRELREGAAVARPQVALAEDERLEAATRGGRQHGDASSPWPA